MNYKLVSEKQLDKQQKNDSIEIIETKCKTLLHPFSASRRECPDEKHRLVINPYVGCEHRCLYCYATYPWFPSFFDKIKVKINAAQILEKQIRDMARKGKNIPPVYISPSTDPYQPIEKRYRITRRCIEVLQKYEIPYFIVTKSDLVLEDIDLHASYEKCALVWTITSLDDIKTIELFSPPPEKRLLALERASSEGIKTLVRIDPILPYITDSRYMLEELVKKIWERGIEHVTSSTLKLRDDIWSRLKRIVERKGLLARYNELYFLNPYRCGVYYYAKKEYRIGVLTNLLHLCSEHDLKFGTCLEGLTHLNTGRCDGIYFKPTTARLETLT